MKYTTRIAPSPSGFLHSGTIRTAYFNYLAAKSSGGKFILRVDDTDPNKSDQKYIPHIYDSFDWLGLDYDVTFKQSDRMDRYNQVASSLVSQGYAQVLDNGAIALVWDSKDFTWTDTLAGDMKASDRDNNALDGLILITGDGRPLYNFTTVIDDIDYGVNWIIRGVDHITNTFKQVGLYMILGADLPKYTHVGLICSKNKPLSKRHQAGSVLKLRDQGYDPDAVLNFLLRMGWGPKVDDKSTKVITKDRALDLFIDGGNMRSAPSNIDLNMLDVYNRRHKGYKKRNNIK